MRTKPRLLLLVLVAIATLTLAACGGDDSKAEKKSSADQTAAAATTQPSGSASGSSGGLTSPRPSGVVVSPSSGSAGRALQLDCGKDLKSFKFDGKLALQTPQGSDSAADFSSIFGSILSDVKYSGAFVSPDRTSFKFEGGKDSPIGVVEFIQIGTTQYTKLGSTGWQQTTSSGGPADIADNFDPREICTQIQKTLSADVPTRKEKVNGVDTTKYEYDKKALEKLGSDGIFGGLAGINGQLPDNAKLNLWVSDKEKFPVKLTMNADSQQDAQKYTVNLELNVTDLNGNVAINAPR